MKPLLALALPLLVQQAALPAWQAADRWTCRMTQLRICDGLGGACRISPNQADFRIDFTAAVFRIHFDPGPYARSAASDRGHDFDEKIVARSWFAPHGEDPGFSKLALDSGDSVTLSVRADGEARDAILTRSQIDSQYLFYGACTPEAKR
jgi:hypothetical protein